MTTFTSGAGFVFSSGTGGAGASLIGNIRLQIVAETASDAVQFFGGPATELSDLIRVGGGPSSFDATPHDAVISIVGTGMPGLADWSFRCGVVRWASSGQAFILFGQDSVSGLEIMIPLSFGVLAFPTITSSASLQGFLGSVTSVATNSANSLVSLLVGTLTEIDIVAGTDGSDDYSVGLGADRVYGGAGADRVYGGEHGDVLFGGFGADRLYGDSGNDTIGGGPDLDQIFGGSGNDLLNGGTGADLMNGDSGADRIFGDSGNDVISGGTGDDTIYGRNDRDQLAGGLGSDSIYGDDANDTLVADWGRDFVYGGLGDDFIYADGNGNSDNVSATDYIDVIYGGLGNDTVVEGSGIIGGPNRIFGDAGADLISGSGNDSVYGGSGSDRINRDGNGNSLVNGDAANDTLRGGLGRDSLFGGVDNDLIYSSSAGGSLVFGGSGNDTVYGSNAAREWLDGDSGNDHFYVYLTSITGQSSVVDGGIGLDRVTLNTLDAASTIVRGSNGLTLTGANGAELVFSGIEQFVVNGSSAMTSNQFYDYWLDILS